MHASPAFTAVVRKSSASTGNCSSSTCRSAALAHTARHALQCQVNHAPAKAPPSTAPVMPTNLSIPCQSAVDAIGRCAILPLRRRTFRRRSIHECRSRAGCRFVLDFLPPSGPHKPGWLTRSSSARRSRERFSQAANNCPSRSRSSTSIGSPGHAGRPPEIPANGTIVESEIGRPCRSARIKKDHYP